MNDYKLIHFDRYCEICKHYDGDFEKEPCYECSGVPAKKDGHVPINFEEDKSKVKQLERPWKNIEKQNDFLYSVDFDELDYDFAKDYYKKYGDVMVPAGCSSFTVGRYFCRKLDWFYDNNVEFLVKTSKKSNRLASIGMSGGIKGLTKQFMESNQPSDMYKLIPFQMLDGINEAGIAMSMNVVPLDKGLNVAQPLIRIEDSICATMLIRYVLDHFQSIYSAMDYIKSFVQWYFPKSIHSYGYEMHFLLSDGIDSYVIEAIDGATWCKKCDLITNFYIHGVRFNEDGSVYTPMTQGGDYTATKYNKITPHGCGLERYNLIHNRRIDILMRRPAILSNIWPFMDRLNYTNAYKPNETNPFWYTEFVGLNNLTVDSQPSEYQPTIEKAISEYQKRSRDTAKTWHSTHSVVYDTLEKKMYLKTQENDGVIMVEKLKEWCLCL